MPNDDAGDSRSTSISRAEKARLYRERLARMERRHPSRGKAAGHPVSRERDQGQTRVLESDSLYDEDADCERISPEQVLALLSRIEQHRHQADAAWREFQDWLDCSRDLAIAWNAFTAAGGFTSREFMQFLDGRFQARRSIRKKHLRLIAASREQTR
jgi:hypothetical protein